MNRALILFISLFLIHGMFAQPALELVQNSLRHIRASEIEKAQQLLDKLQVYEASTLEKELDNQQAATSFWLNYYNAIVQILLIQDPRRYEDRNAFFSKKWCIVAGQELSLDDIEHGIIRGSKHKYTLGFTTKFFVEDFEETFRLAELDYRIHFALNCGALSCPPVAIYEVQQLDKQLDASAKIYLQREVMYDSGREEVQVPVLCQWFYADFGKEAGIREMLRTYLPDLQVSEEAEITYLDYNWTISTQNFIDLDEY